MRVWKGFLGVALILAAGLLAACAGGLFTARLEGSLLFGPIAGTKFVVSVTEMPSGGLASIEIQTEAGFYSGMEDLSVQGTNGFEVISASFDDVQGILKLVAVRTLGGLEGGPVVAIHFDRNGSPAYDTGKIGAVVLGSAENSYIRNYSLVADRAYYTKEVESR